MISQQEQFLSLQVAARHKWAWLCDSFCTPYKYICVILSTNRQYILNKKWVWLTKKETMTHTITIDNAAQYNDKGEWLYIREPKSGFTHPYKVNGRGLQRSYNALLYVHIVKLIN